MTLSEKSGIHFSGSGAYALDVELDTLRQGQSTAVIDSAGHAPHIGLPSIGAGFAPSAGLLLAPESAADLCTRRAHIHIGQSAIGARGRKEALGFAQVGGEDGR